MNECNVLNSGCYTDYETAQQNEILLCLRILNTTQCCSDCVIECSFHMACFMQTELTVRRDKYFIQ